MKSHEKVTTLDHHEYIHNGTTSTLGLLFGKKCIFNFVVNLGRQSKPEAHRSVVSFYFMSFNIRLTLFVKGFIYQ
jgi:hypothetical protein